MKLHTHLDYTKVWATLQGVAFISIFIIHLGMYNPDRSCNKGFPFHATVSQMGGNKKDETIIKVKGLSDDKKSIEKTITLKAKDFEMLNLYCARIQVLLVLFEFIYLF